MTENQIIIVRGGGDIATGTIHRLHTCGYHPLVLESEAPSAIRRTVSFSDAIYSGTATVEGVTAVHIHSLDQCRALWEMGKIPLINDPTASSVKKVAPHGVIDAIIAKKNVGTTMDMAPVTIGLGPGFTGGKDVHAVIETCRGHNLGRVMYSGSTAADTGTPGSIEGYSRERVVYAKRAGELKIKRDIGISVHAGETIAHIAGSPVSAPITGLVRGMLADGFRVHKGLKIADIDPRAKESENCHTISDKARCISGGVLEALIVLTRKLSS